MMIEANNPEINVDELMQSICNEVAKRQVHSQQLDSKSNFDTSKMRLKISNIEALLKNAESRSCIRTKWPDQLNRFPLKFHAKLQKVILKAINFLFKDQREVNFNLINSLKESVALNCQLIEQITTLKAQMDERLCAVDTRLEGMDQRLCAVDTRLEGMDQRLCAVDTRLEGMDQRLCAVDTRLEGMDQRLCAVDTRLEGMDQRLCAVDTRLEGMDDSFNTIDTWMSSWITGTQEHLGTVDSRVQGLDQHLGTVDSRVQGLDQHLGTVDNRVQGLDQHLVAVDSRVQGLDQRYIRNDSYLKNDLMQQKRLITLFLEEAGRRLPEPFNQEQLQAFVKEDQHSLDAFYLAFEDQFRGSREDIFNRLKVYLPLIEEAKIGTPDSLILDVGCGRGEWLELLQKTGYTARGLDINRIMVEQCKARGLEVIEKDALSYLQSLPDSSLGAVTGFHIIEHLPFKDLLKLFGEAARVLQTGGLVIFETPNPQNVLVGSCNFYYDPTHRKPLPPLTIEYIAQSYGFSYVQILKLNPSEQNRIADNSELAQRFNEYFYGSMDYAVIGFKS